MPGNGNRFPPHVINAARGVLVFLLVVINVAVLYFCLTVNPYRLYFIGREVPWSVDLSPTADVIGIAVMLVLVVLTIFMIYISATRHRIFYWAPIFSGLVIVSWLVARLFLLPSPDRSRDWDKDGYSFKEEIWQDSSRHSQTYKRWKSVYRRTDLYQPQSLHFVLDSMSTSALPRIQ
jgi:magnesium-transporting ATPase (P-type)